MMASHELHVVTHLRILSESKPLEIRRNLQLVSRLSASIARVRVPLASEPWPTGDLRGG
jgi:hypothetical protein